MTTYRYRLLDVFTDRPFGGNPLAVFTDAQGLSGEAMQSIARELNLSETTFVLPPRNPSHHYWVRIFTPLAELQNAGHPTIGTAYALALEERIRREQEAQRVVFEEESGPVSVMLESPMITMQQPLPEFGPIFDQREAVAAMLGVEHGSLVPTLPIQSVACGVPYLIVPIADLASIASVRLRSDIWDRLLRRSPHPHIIAFTLAAHHAHSNVHMRVLLPGLGIPEDPATATGAGALAAYLVRYNLVENRPRVFINSEQGIEIGRPSAIHISVEREDARVISVRVGGQCVAVGEGRIAVGD